MRKITRDAITAFDNKTNFERSNTKVQCVAGSQFLNLFNNVIAVRCSTGELFISSAGHKTVTTKERLNGLSNVHIVQKKGQWFLNGKAWNGETIQVE